ncbi:pyrimidine 5'-nucleotidase [Gibbsiella greigii]
MNHQAMLQISDWIFDLDNTLYPKNSGLWGQVDARITAWITHFFDISEAEAMAIRKDYFLRYGTALRGLMKEYQVKPEEYLDYIYKIDYSVLSRDSLLQSQLASIPGRKIIFTSSPKWHATQVLEVLGISSQITDIFDIADAGYVPKPAEQTYERFIDKFGIVPEHAIMFEDTLANLSIPKVFGMKTVFITTSMQHEDHYACENVNDFFKAL